MSTFVIAVLEDSVGRLHLGQGDFQLGPGCQLQIETNLEFVFGHPPIPEAISVVHQLSKKATEQTVVCLAQVQ